MFDYKNDAKIACTQPRIPPTIGNATTNCSSQMGVPIKEYNNSTKKRFGPNNYYVQYKYQGKSHDNKQKGLVLKIMTDGTLEQAIQESSY